MKTQSFDFHRERLMQIKEQNKMVNEEVDKALKNLNIDLKDEILETNENQVEKKKQNENDFESNDETITNNDLSDDKIEELYKKYKQSYKKKQNMNVNNQYINPPTGNYNFKRNKSVKPTVSNKYK
jgi:hypothetical protein